MVVKLYPHQELAVEELGNGKVLVGGVGTGKTMVSLFYFYTKIMAGVVGDYASICYPTDIYVFTTARKRDELDWHKAAAQLGISTDRSASVANILLTVDSYNNIEKYRGVKGAFIILDEQRMVGSGAWTKAFLHLAKANEWIMLSATPGDKWEDYIPLFLANGFYRNRSEFKREHCVYSYYGRYPKLERYLGVAKLVRLRNSILVEMPYERHTKRHIHEIPVDYDKDLFKKVVKDRWHVYEDRPIQEISELFSVMRKVVNSDVTRLERVKTLMLAHPRLIVFYNFDYELEILRNLVEESTQTSVSPKDATTKLVLAEWNGHKHDPWEFTIWAEDWKPEPGQKDPRESVGSIKAKYEFERKTKREEEWATEKVIPIGLNESKLKNKKNSSGGLGQDSSILMKPKDGKRQESSTIQIAEWNGHKHEPLPTSERWVYLVQYQAGAEAWNCTTTDTVVFYSLTYSYKNYVQAQGRIDRLNTPFLNLNYYVLLSEAKIDQMVMSALRGKRDFNEKNFRVYT